MSKKLTSKPPPKDIFLTAQKEKQIIDRIALSNPQNQAEYKVIIKNLEGQGKKLYIELDLMSEQVKKLTEKSKTDKPQIDNMAKQVLERKTELQLKYRQFDEVKKELESAKARNLDPEVQAKLQNNNNLLKKMGKEIEQLEDTKKKLVKYLRNNNESIKEYDQEELPQELEQLLRENKDLKKKTQEERRKEQESRQEEIKAQKNYIDLKMKARKMEGKQTVDLKSSSDLKTLKEQSYNKEAILDIEKAVEVLRSKKEEIQSKQQYQKLQKTRKKEQLFKKNAQLLQQSRVLENEKVKLKQQLNKYEALSLEINSSKKKDREVRKKDNQNQQVQTDSKQALLLLRRDYAGVIGKNRFDDRLSLLDNNFNTRINKVIVYENAKSIAAVKFEYFDEGYPDHIYETEMIVPQAYLNKCKKKSFEVSKTNDFFKLFKVKSLTQDKRITKIEIVSNLNIKSEFGDKKSFEDISKDETVYGFDVNASELPVCMFGSLSQVGSEWFLESLGAQIKGFNEKVKV